MSFPSIQDTQVDLGLPDSRHFPQPTPRVAHFEEMAFGMFVHWGLYSQLGKGEWVRHLGQVSLVDYERLIGTFSAEDFEARALARLAREAGQRYITLTTRHHDGFSLYDTLGLSEFDAPHSLAKRDLVAEFVEGCRAEGIIPFLYHTTLDWRWGSHTCTPEKFREYLEYLHASVEVLCTNYGDIGGFWFDGNWSRTDLDWNEDRLYATIRRHQPEAMIVNNTGLVARGQAGHPEIDSVTFEQSLPKPLNRRGWKKYISGEMCQTMNTHWGVTVDDFAFLSPREIIENLCLSRRVGGNYLLNIGAGPQGAIPEYEAAALRICGRWVALHEEPLRNGRPLEGASAPGRDFLLCMEKGKMWWFVFDLSVSGDANVNTGSDSPEPRKAKGISKEITGVHWLDSGEPLNFTQENGSLCIDFTSYPYGKNLVVRIAEITCAENDCQAET